MSPATTGLRDNALETVPIPETERVSWKVRLRHQLIRKISTGLTVPNAILGDRITSGFGILMYHRCCRPPSNVPAPSLNVTPDQFKMQVRGLLDRGLRILPLPTLIARLSRGEPIARCEIAITFDDGYAGMNHDLLPILKRLNIPVSIFVCTKFIGSDRPMPFDRWGQQVAGRVPVETYRSLNQSECGELLDSGLVDIGAHTHSHEDFRGRVGDFQNDLETCVAQLERDFSITGPTFAFPFGTPSLGYADPALQTAARETGIQCAVTTEAVVNNADADPFALGRFNVFEWDTAATIHARLNGWYSWLPTLSGSLRSAARRTHSAAGSAYADKKMAPLGGNIG